MILKFLQPFHGVNNIPKIIFFYVSFLNLDIPIRNNNERYWEYWFNLPAWKQVIFFIFSWEKKGISAATLCWLFSISFEADFYGDREWVGEELLAPGQCSQKSLKDLSWSINICSTEPLY